MQRLQQVFFGIISLIIAAFTLAFILLNTQMVSINLLTYNSPPVPLSVIMMLSLVAGMLIALLISSIFFMSIKLRLSSARRQLNKYKKELSKQNTVPVLKTK